MSEHASGKWLHDNDWAMVFEEGKEDNKYVCTLDRTQLRDRGHSEETMNFLKTNGDKIVAAHNNTYARGINPEAVPDLVILVKQAVLRLDLFHGDDPSVRIQDSEDLMKGWLVDARAALDKAKP